MNPVVKANKAAKAKEQRPWREVLKRFPGAEPKTLTRQRRRAIAYDIALRAVNKEFGNVNRNGVVSFTISRKARHNLARATAKTALAKDRMNKVARGEG